MDPVRSLYFGAPGSEALGWLHAGDLNARRGLVICSSFGREDLCIHRSLRHIAMTAARQGIPALRFDYPGSGDSAGSEFGDGLVDRWIKSIAEAIDLLKQETGVEDVCLLGVRLGSLLAARAAAGRADVAGLVAIAPVTAGRLFVREMKAYSLGAASMGLNVPRERADHLLEAGGFAMDLATQEALRTIDLLGDTRAPDHPTLIIERDDIPADSRWLQHLQTLGADAESRRIPGYAGMIRESTPHHCEVPERIIDAVIPWVIERAPRATRPDPDSLVPVSSSLRWASRQGTPVIEQVVGIDVGVSLAALVTAPATQAADGGSRRALVLLSGGADRRIGPGRLFVQLAREWAARGFVVMRLDLSGMGDSPARPGSAENTPYLRNALDDIEAAVRHLRSHWHVTHCQLIGVCAGAYNALRAAVETTTVDGIVMINPLLYLSVGDAPVELAERKAEVIDSMRGYKRNISDWARWRALLTDPTKMLRVLRNVAGMVRDKSINRSRDVLRRLGMPLRDDLPSELLLLARRRTRIRLVFSDDEHGETLLWSLGGSTVNRLMRQGHLSIDHSRGADHLYTLVADREALFGLLSRLVDPQSGEVELAPGESHPNAVQVSKSMA